MDTTGQTPSTLKTAQTARIDISGLPQALCNNNCVEATGCDGVLGLFFLGIQWSRFKLGQLSMVDLET